MRLPDFTKRSSLEIRTCIVEGVTYTKALKDMITKVLLSAHAGPYCKNSCFC